MQSILSQTGVIIAVIVGWLFFTGFLYAYLYFQYYGLPITQAEIPYYTFTIYGSFVVENCLTLVLLLCVSLFAQAYFIWRMNISGLRALVIVVFNVAVCFAAAYRFSHKTAEYANETLENCQKQPMERFEIDNCSRIGRFVRVFLQTNELKDLGAPRLPSEQLRLGCYMLFWPDKEGLNLVPYLGPDTSQPLSRLRLLLSQIKGYELIDKPPPECPGGLGDRRKQ